METFNWCFGLSSINQKLSEELEKGKLLPLKIQKAFIFFVKMTLNVDFCFSMIENEFRMNELNLKLRFAIKC